ncbi:hypothetical protein CMV_000575 [Castanea mollissima]|uniref:ORM1-like protein 3 n=1 Tax=Castanea mollissima TaxID=60419 RepID=A0A8J4S1A7_9ROSI|nr:hypothetical protein CMV_000575 [Castanea mollissima]
MYVKAVRPTDLNRNTEWFTYPGVWTTYILILFFSWLIVLSVLNCSSGLAWTIVHLAHFLVTYHFFHWKKGTPFADDQGIYNRLTWWEQIDSGKQLTRNRKFLTVVPVVLYLIASHTTDYQHPMLFFNTLAVFVLVVAKFPHMHKVNEVPDPVSFYWCSLKLYHWACVQNFFVPNKQALNLWVMRLLLLLRW